MQIIPISDTTNYKLLTTNSTYIYPTDTCYGIGCSIFSESGLRKVYEAKGRNFQKPVSVMVQSYAELWKYGKYSPLAEKIANKFLPGDVTLLLGRTDQLPDFLNPGNTHVGLRIINHPFCDALLTLVQTPIVTTSANIAGEPELYDSEEIQTAFADREDLVDILFYAGTLPKNPPSTIIKIIGDDFEIIRQGRVTEQMIQEIINNPS